MGEEEEVEEEEEEGEDDVHYPPPLVGGGREAPGRRLGPGDLQPMMDMLDEVERSCLGKSEASVRSSVRASVDRCE